MSTTDLGADEGDSMEIAVLVLFCCALLACVIVKLSVLYALAFGLVIFVTYAKVRHFAWREIGSMVLSGIKTVRGILTVFLLIGILTAVWRVSGTLPTIIALAMQLVQPRLMLLLAFLLNCLVSVLTGTAFGTAATMGVICMSMANSMGINPLLTGGAILSGVFFGDRCSPVSTSALLVKQLTHTQLFTNIRNMLKTGAVPFVAACVVYGIFGIALGARSGSVDVTAVFSREFDLRWFMVIPAILMLALAIGKVDVKIAMGVSIVLAVGLGYFFQGESWMSLGRSIVFGYSARTAEVGRLLNGGGIVSMVNVAAIVCLSSAYAGIFERTELLSKIKSGVGAMESKIGNYAGMLVTSVVTSMVACNQTLAIMLTDQLSAGVGEGHLLDERRRESTALDLEDTAVVVSPLIPWSIAGAVPLSSAGAPEISVVAACFLYLVPLCRLAAGGIRALKTRWSLRTDRKKVMA